MAPLFVRMLDIVFLSIVLCTFLGNPQIKGLRFNAILTSAGSCPRHAHRAPLDSAIDVNFELIRFGNLI